MKVLFVLLIGLNKPGPSVHLLKDMISAVRSTGAEIVCIQRCLDTADCKTPEEFENDCGIRFINVLDRDTKNSNFALRYLGDIRYALRLKKYYKQQKDATAAFIQSNRVGRFFVSPIKRIIGCKTVFNVQDIFPLNAYYSGHLKKTSVIYKIATAVQKKAYKAADAVITISQDMKSSLINEGVPEEKISVVYNWSYSDTAYNIPKNDNQFLDMLEPADRDKFKVIYAGNIGAVQDAECIAEAAERLQEHEDIVFYLIGNGIRKEKIRQSVEQKGLKNIRIMDMLPPALAPSVYSTADVNLIPFVNGIVHTALPSKTATIAACRRPVVAPMGKECDLARIFKNVEGYIFTDSSNTDGLCSAILEIKEKHIEYADTKEIFETFFTTKNVQKYVETLGLF